MALSDVSNILWRERQLLELLVFKLEEEQLVLAAGRTRLARARYPRSRERPLRDQAASSSTCGAGADAGRELALSGLPTLRALAVLPIRRGTASSPSTAVRSSRSRKRSTPSPNRIENCCNAATRPRVKRSPRWARSTSTCTTRTAPCPIVPSLSGSSTRRSVMSDFSGLRLALTALQAQQAWGRPAAENVVHANTPRYSCRGRRPGQPSARPPCPRYLEVRGFGRRREGRHVTRFRDQFMEIRPRSSTVRRRVSTSSRRR